jgi:hypothetical protein
MEKGEMRIEIVGPAAEMKVLAERLAEAIETWGDPDSAYPACIEEVDHIDDYIWILSDYNSAANEQLETWKEENPHWDIKADFHVWGWGPQSLHRWENGNEVGWHFEDIDLENMDPVCEALVGQFTDEDEIREMTEYLTEEL